MASFSSIINTPAIRAIVQQGLLVREFKDALFPRLLFRGEAIPAEFPTHVGDQLYFTGKGLLREISIDSSSSYFDTNTGNHHHFYFERSGHLEDIAAERVNISALPEAPGGAEISRVDVIIRVRS